MHLIIKVLVSLQYAERNDEYSELIFANEY